MKRINNKNGIKMFWERANDIDKINIFDSNGNYFNDLYLNVYKDDNGNENIDEVLRMFEDTTLENMCNFFNASRYKSLEDLAGKENLCLAELKDNEYLNIFNVSGKIFYTWSC